MNARNEIAEQFKRLTTEFEKRKHELKKQGEIVDATEDWNARMIVLRGYADSVFFSSFSLMKEILMGLSTALNEVEGLEKSLDYERSKLLETHSSLEHCRTENEQLRRLIVLINREIELLKERVTRLEMRPPGGNPPSTATARYR